MSFLKQLATFFRPRKVATNSSFCRTCPMTEGKAEFFYIGVDGQCYCSPECCGRHGIMIESVYNVKEKKMVRA